MSDATLIALWETAKSASEIAAEVGMSKNAVLGRVRRLRERGLTKSKAELGFVWRGEALGHGAPLTYAERLERKRLNNEASKRRIIERAKERLLGAAAAREARLSARKESYVEVEVTEEDLANSVGLMDLRPCHCRYILGAPSGGDTRYCGGARVVPTSWCAKHLPVVAIPAPKRRKKNSEGKRSLQWNM